MKCEYIDGNQFHRAFSAGCRAVFKQAENLNGINVFPVADRDTGTNLTLTLKSIINGSSASDDLHQTINDMSEAALSGAQGNSGIIFAQYLLGLGTEVKTGTKTDTKEFALIARQAVNYVYASLLNPVEGTVLTVMRDWADSLVTSSRSIKDFSELMEMSFTAAQKSLNETLGRLKILADSNVPDAGAQGFVNFLEGVIDYIKQGINLEGESADVPAEDPNHDLNPIHAVTEYPAFRYCAECILTHCKKTIEELKEKYKTYGDSLIIAGNSRKLHLHIHTNNPEQLFFELYKDAYVTGVKADDMLTQYNMVHNRKYTIGLMADSAADLPVEMISQYQIMQVSFGINFKHIQFLDKVTIQPEAFYRMLRLEKHSPQSSLPSLRVLDTAMHFMDTHYDKTICLHISSGLSSTYQMSSKISERYKGISVVDSKHLSVTEGLLLLRTARAIEAGMAFENVLAGIAEWSKKTFIYTDIASLKYMVRGGRVSPLKGLVAKLMNIKPIVSVDENGKGIAYGKSYSRKANFKKILKIISDLRSTDDIWEYAIVHSDAEARAILYAEKLTALLGKAPAYILPLSPVVGVHNGIGAVAVGISLK
jgi:DegV family protein with EDD domain